LFAAVTIAICIAVSFGLAQTHGGQAAPAPAKASAQPTGSAAQDKPIGGKKERHQQTAATKGASGGKAGASSDSRSANTNSPFGAFASSNRGPISIQSDSLALDYKQNAVVFHGHVHATQADGALASDLLNVKYGKDFHQVQNMTADGNVHISQGVRWCTSEHAVMDEGQHIVILTGSPICHDARDQIAGTRITVHLDTGKSDVEAAKAVIFPQQSKTRDNEALADDAK
jgi:lipopolysaccharide transport protein LptA